MLLALKAPLYTYSPAVLTIGTACGRGRGLVQGLLLIRHLRCHSWLR